MKWFIDCIIEMDHVHYKLLVLKWSASCYWHVHGLLNSSNYINDIRCVYINQLNYSYQKRLFDCFTLKASYRQIKLGWKRDYKTGFNITRITN